MQRKASNQAYEQDVNAWANEQEGLLRAGQFSRRDIEPIAEAIDDLGKSEQRELAGKAAAMSASRGFTRIEWLIIVVVLGVLAAAAYPVVRNYMIRPRFAEVIAITAPYKQAIEACARDGSCVVAGTLEGLGVGVKGLPPAIVTTYLARIVVASNGTITATASKAGGLEGETYVLAPTLTSSGQVAWTITGSCKTREAGVLC